MASQNSYNRGSTNTSRRIFRGSGGPTDGRLNKHQARRRKTSHATNSSTSKYDGPKQEQVDNVTNQEESNQSEHDSVEEIVDKSERQSENTTSPADTEIQHLLRRVKNVKESIQLSSEANVNPSTWQQNVLNPVKNCVGEWRAILNHNQEELDSSDTKEPALEVFQLIQMAMQSGPLAGSKPGYFKRCGATAAKQALDFLDASVATKEDATSLQFSEKQAEAIDKWKENAKKAIENDKPPSKSVLKKQAKQRSQKKK